MKMEFLIVTVLPTLLKILPVFLSRFKDDILVVSWKSGDAAGEAQVKNHRKRRKTGILVLGQHTGYTLYTASDISDEDCTKYRDQFNGIKLSRIMGLNHTCRRLFLCFS